MKNNTVSRLLLLLLSIYTSYSKINCTTWLKMYIDTKINVGSISGEIF